MTFHDLVVMELTVMRLYTESLEEPIPPENMLSTIAFERIAYAWALKNGIITVDEYVAMCFHSFGEGGEVK